MIFTTKCCIIITIIYWLHIKNVVLLLLQLTSFIQHILFDFYYNLQVSQNQMFEYTITEKKMLTVTKIQYFYESKHCSIVTIIQMLHRTTCCVIVTTIQMLHRTRVASLLLQSNGVLDSAMMFMHCYKIFRLGRRLDPDSCLGKWPKALTESSFCTIVILQLTKQLSNYSTQLV